ncbi:nuclear transport factor 2 family protein [Novosphingobium sp. FSY-8]|uniref:Nuclear transport factor 2 family protein n=1 Tax=Novosphingobium ovatum TaxID=1908523 RepID=A0ABW9XDT8_9SPHN|nr:nuclear transport factor 2 family protein [Novosphingobium ovatum]NBC36694.1 nuclear transport factor 2 family protein [Novosphingobium ovatum]
MTDIERMLAEHAIARLITGYVGINDANRWDELADTYAEHGRMNRPTAPDDWVEGREAIRASFKARPPRAARHIVANIVVDVAEDGLSATASSQILLFVGTAAPDGGIPAQSPKPPMVGSYADRLVCEGGRWLFVERRGSLDFTPPA